MHVKRLNAPILDLASAHPARRFLEAFIRCRETCVGREIEYEDSPGTSIDQEWFSATDGRIWRFSSFAYEFLSFDVILDGWLTQAEDYTESELIALRKLPHLRRLMEECEEAARDARNVQILEAVSQVQEVFRLWHECITLRRKGDDGDGTTH